MIEKNFLIESFKNMRKSQKKEFTDLILKEISKIQSLELEIQILAKDMFIMMIIFLLLFLDWQLRI